MAKCMGEIDVENQLLINRTVNCIMSRCVRQDKSYTSIAGILQDKQLNAKMDIWDP